MSRRMSGINYAFGAAFASDPVGFMIGMLALGALIGVGLVGYAVYTQFIDPALTSFGHGDFGLGLLKLFGIFSVLWYVVLFLFAYVKSFVTKGRDGYAYRFTMAWAKVPVAYVKMIWIWSTVIVLYPIAIICRSFRAIRSMIRGQSQI